MTLCLEPELVLALYCSSPAPASLKERREKRLSLRILPPELEVPDWHGGDYSPSRGHDEMRDHGLPLRVFHNRCHMEPYLPMELLALTGGG